MLKQKTVYFREEDLPLWAAIENKAEWLHQALNDKSSRAVKYGDKLIVLNGQDPLKTYDATTEKTYTGSEAPSLGRAGTKDGKTEDKPMPVIKTKEDAKEVVKTLPKNLCPHGNKYGACTEVKCLTAYRMGVR